MWWFEPLGLLGLPAGNFLGARILRVTAAGRDCE
jgi:hypothetical protein